MRIREIKIIAQDFNIYDGDALHSSARTGAISIDHLISAGAQGVILGHSETQDSPIIINRKLKTLLNNNRKKVLADFTIIILIGESWREFENKTFVEIADSLYKKCKIIFNNIPEKLLMNLIIGYEPKWGSRGSGRDDMPPPQPKLISICINKLRQYIKDHYQNIKPFYIYGGRSTPLRTKQILQDKSIDGLILGSACNTLNKTIHIIHSMQKIKKNQNKVVICNFKAYILPDPYKKYINELNKLSNNFFIYLAPPYTDIRLVEQLIKKTLK